MPASLLVLMDHHKELGALLQEHQEALIGLDLARAKDRLLAYEQKLLAHMRHEETKILPRYALLPVVRGAPVEYFTGEHQRIRERLAEVRERVLPLEPDLPDLKRRIVDAFDRTALMKAILEHHDLREGQFLYPRLEEVTTEDERREMLKEPT